MTPEQFKADFDKKFKRGLWALEFGDGPLNLVGNVTWDEEEREDGLIAFTLWPDEERGFGFLVNPDHVVTKDHQWEAWNLAGSKRRFALRPLRADQKVPRG